MTKSDSKKSDTMRQLALVAPLAGIVLVLNIAMVLDMLGIIAVSL